MDGQTMLFSVKCRVDLHRKHFPNGATSAEIKLLDDVQEVISWAYQAGREAEGVVSPQDSSNNASLGYVIMAAERVGLKQVQIYQMVQWLHRLFDEITLEEAAEHYMQSDY
ncbi:hypothetical protein [Paenibacillus sp. GXUN7292]|uniref:hypothetical protein n=1 Tax=Paenibacillus sp. GXUN7292 TaxID=3422499 RepID=UPI003D7DAA7C